ncbi:MAG: N-6 DNA methylase [Opitutales bacterium]|nr:N-6 DNA methylase [Opitutales bacterium]
MAIKKSALYSHLWASCDELRGGMDSSQYKDYVLVMLFIKYASDKYAGKPFAPIKIPEGASFADMVALKGKPDIGDQINKRIIAPLEEANPMLTELPDFANENKLGSGREMVDRLTRLIAIFENKALDFSRNRADGDDILGDAYEYLMRNFATESGKSKGQFYTPAEVSRIIARVLEIDPAKTSANTTVYDPTCGSGSLLLKVGDEAGGKVTLNGQEKDAATVGLAYMNMILHNYPTAVILPGNTIANPKFTHGDALKTFDYVVANPPFSDKGWSSGLDPEHDPFGRFDHYGVPPAKQGDYAYLLHIVRSLKSTGRGVCVLPHGVLFRGHAEAAIRRKLIQKGFIKGIIGLPANLFYGTGIPACLVVIDKAGAHEREGIFLIDASEGYLKDGPKNRLRSMDMHKIVDAFTKQLDLPGFSRFVPLEEIAANDYNLNIPRYIDSNRSEDRQNIEAHLHGGIPDADLDTLTPYWQACPRLRAHLLSPQRKGFSRLTVDPSAVQAAIQEHPEFAAFRDNAAAHFQTWRDRWTRKLRTLAAGFQPKDLIFEISEDILAHYADLPLIGKYLVYQHLMDYWAETMQDDAYLIAADGWVAKTERILVKDKKGKERDKGWTCDLVPRSLIVARFFPQYQEALAALETDLETTTAELTELEEEHSGEDGVFADFDKINKIAVTARKKELQAEEKRRKPRRESQKVAEDPGRYGRTKEEPPADNPLPILSTWLKLQQKQTDLKKQIKDAEATLDQLAYDRYPQLTTEEIQTLVIEDKWMGALEERLAGETDRVSQTLTQRLRDLAERYRAPLVELTDRVAELETKVQGHLNRMGFPVELKN